LLTTIKISAPRKKYARRALKSDQTIVTTSPDGVEVKKAKDNKRGRWKVWRDAWNERKTDSVRTFSLRTPAHEILLEVIVLVLMFLVNGGA